MSSSRSRSATCTARRSARVLGGSFKTPSRAHKRLLYLDTPENVLNIVDDKVVELRGRTNAWWRRGRLFSFSVARNLICCYRPSLRSRNLVVKRKLCANMELRVCTQLLSRYSLSGVCYKNRSLLISAISLKLASDLPHKSLITSIVPVYQIGRASCRERVF